MNSKDLIKSLALKNNLSENEISDMLFATINHLKNALKNDKTLTIKGFGVFEVRKKNERISVHPVTKEKMLVPPKLVLNFKQSSILKDKFKEV